MVNNSISVVLADSCCKRNYILSKVVGRPVWFRGRKYWFEVTDSKRMYHLFCNGYFIGVLFIDEVIIFDDTLRFINSRDELMSLVSMFNLYPC